MVNLVFLRARHFGQPCYTKVFAGNIYSIASHGHAVVHVTYYTANVAKPAEKSAACTRAV